VQLIDDDYFPKQVSKTGSLYGLFARKVAPPIKKADWNSLRVRLEGRKIQVWINDVQTIDSDLDAASGPIAKQPGLNRKTGRIGLQQNQKADVEFRNAWIKPLGEVGFVPLFNGKDLAGWEGLPGAWRLDKGSLVGSLPATRDRNTTLWSTKIYKDFELKFQVKLHKGTGNSGVQIRSAVGGKFPFQVVGPQVEVDAVGGLGGLYWEGGGKWMKRAADAVVRRVYKPAEFNDYFVRVVGKRVKIVVNSETLVDDDFSDLPDEGLLGFQLHAGNRDDVTFREVLIRDLTPTEQGFVPLFNGKDLTGWKTGGTPKDQTKWEVRDGILTGQGQGPTSYLYADQGEFADFHLRVEARINQTGNSGIFFRVPAAADFSKETPSPLEAQITLDVGQGQKTGALYNRSGNTGKLHHAAGEWFTMEIIVQSGRIRMMVNGQTTCDTAIDATRDPGRGYIGLQRWGGQPTVVEFRKMEIKRLEAVAADPDRAAAEWVLGIGGQVIASQGSRATTIRSGEPLPVGPFQVTRVFLPVQIQDKWADADLARLAGLAGLRSVGLEKFGGIGDGTLARLADIPALVEIGFFGETSITETGLAHLARLPGLKKLSFSAPRLTDADAVALAKLATLDALSMTVPKLSEAGFAPLGRLTGLKTLQILGPPRLTAKAINALAGLDLVKVQFRGLTDDGLAALTKHAKVFELWMPEGAYTDEGLKSLTAFRKVASVTMNSTGVRGSGLKHLAQATSLGHLNLNGSVVDDSALEAVRDFRWLTYLGLVETKVTDAGLVHLTGLTGLQTLDLNRTRVSDAAIPHLSKLTGLRTLQLDRTLVTPTGLRKLMEALPNCKIIPEPK
jgi:hypothetical protein